MRPLQHWLHFRVPRWAWRRGTLQVGITQQCHRSLSPWTDLAFLRAAAPLEQVSRHTVVPADASSTGWGATCNGQAASGLWTGPRDSTSLAHSSEEGPPFSGARHHMAPASRSMEPPCVAPDRAHFYQTGRGPPGVFGKPRVPCVRTGLLSRCLETPAWIRAQGSHHALPQSGGEPASTALGGGRSSLSVAVSHKRIAHISGPHLERQKL